MQWRAIYRSSRPPAGRALLCRAHFARVEGRDRRDNVFQRTDGNHGRGVAWAAKTLGQKAVIMMPKGSQAARFENIRAEGALTTIEELNYDDCVRKAAKAAAETPNGVLIQDTRGRARRNTIVDNAGLRNDGDGGGRTIRGDCAGGADARIRTGRRRLARGGGRRILRQQISRQSAGLSPSSIRPGGLLYRSACAGDGSIRTVGGDMRTIMAGLACGEPSITSWQILKDKVTAFASLPDRVAADGMRVLERRCRATRASYRANRARPRSASSTRSCAAKNYRRCAKSSKSGKDSRVLLFSTEGATDPENYRKVVWEGSCGSR